MGVPTLGGRSPLYLKLNVFYALAVAELVEKPTPSLLRCGPGRCHSEYVNRQRTETQPLMEITPELSGLGVFLCAIAVVLLYSTLVLQ